MQATALPQAEQSSPIHMVASVARLILSVAVMLTLVCSPVSAGSAVPAFPGAQGGGAVSVGGRGGQVIEVTNLNDSGSGSLRACVTASGPRTCVFRVGGTINLLSALYITNPYLTVAGQTAPGDGILIKGPNNTQDMIPLEAHDVIWRYTRVAHGYNQTLNDIFRSQGNSSGANFNLYAGSYNTILDHNSTYWNMDEGLGAWADFNTGLSNVTFSYNIVAEAMATHSTGYLVGGSFASGMVNIDIHHNLTMNNSHRNPQAQAAEMRHVNNLTYNNKLRIVQLQPSGGLNIKNDFIGNIYKQGPLNLNPTQGLAHEYMLAGPQSLYLSLNKGFTQPDPNGDQWIMAYEGYGNGPEVGPAPSAWRRTTPLPNTLLYPITAEPVASLEASLLPIVGAARRLACDGTWVTNRNSVDSRLINQYQTNTGISSLVSNESEVGGFPVTLNGTPCLDTDHDGMPDVWETARGLNPQSAADTNQDRDGDGYTNLEEYLNGTGAGSGSTDNSSPAAPSGFVVR